MEESSNAPIGRERFATNAEDIRIAYDDAGSGEPALLLMPGWASSRRVFAPLLPRVSKSQRVLALDWRGHGSSGDTQRDFGMAQLVDDAIAVIEASGAQSVIPVALSHAGWVAIELRKRLGARIPKLVLLDWIIFDAPPPFLGGLGALQQESSWRDVREQLFSMWRSGSENQELAEFLRTDMGAFPFEMWSRAGREIAAAYGASGSPMKALAALQPPPPVLHIYAQPDDPDLLRAQQAHAGGHAWFDVVKLDARTHFPMFEVPDEMATAIESFVRRTDNSD